MTSLPRSASHGARIEGALYDGFPRTIAQASALSRVLAARGEDLTAVIAIDVPRATLVERLPDDASAPPADGSITSFPIPAADGGVCDVCGGTVVQRADDTPEAVAKRLDLYDIETAPLVDRYEEQGLVERVDGNRPIDDVTESIVAAIQSRTEQSTARGR